LDAHRALLSCHLLTSTYGRWRPICQNIMIYQPPGVVKSCDETIASAKRKHAPPQAEEQTNKEGDAGSPTGNTLKHRGVEDACSAREVATEQQYCECCRRKLSNGANLDRTCYRWAHWNCSMGCLEYAGWHCLDCWQLNAGSCPTCRPLGNAIGIRGALVLQQDTHGYLLPRDAQPRESNL
jgi:hypothetical protein